MFWKDPTPSPEEGSKLCPDDFPNWFPGVGNIGDLCRNNQTHGLNVGWNCPGDCVGIVAEVEPYCKMSSSDDSPCVCELCQQKCVEGKACVAGMQL